MPTSGNDPSPSHRRPGSRHAHRHPHRDKSKENHAQTPPSGAPSWYGDRPPLLGDFEIQDLIGHGAMGAVFKAGQRSMDRIVAVKILRPRLAEDPEYVQRFFEEARAAARLNHPNLVLAIDVGQDHGLYYFAMERVEGHTAKLLMRASPFDETRGLEIARQVALALDYAWTQEHIVHRDVKPANIIITPKGTVKLADLGLAHDPELAEQGRKTTNGGIVGTPLYIAPEQVRRRLDLDVRCDLYALGASLFHMVAGRPPFEGKNSKDVVAKHLKAPVPDPREIRPDLSEGFARVVMRLMAKSRDDRYASAKDLVADIDALLAPPQGHAASTRARPAQHFRRRRRRAFARQAVTAGIVVAILLGGGLALWALSRRPPATSHPPPPPRPGKPSNKPTVTPAMKAYEAALKFVQQHADDYTACVTRLRGIEAAYPNTPQARYAAERRREMETKLNRRAQRILTELTRTARKHVAEGHYAEAMACFDGFPANFRTDAWKRELALAQQDIKDRARERFDRALKDADELARTGMLDGAVATYSKLRETALPEWRPDVDKRLDAIREKQQEAEDRVRAERWARLREHYQEQLPKLYHARQYEEAVQLIHRAAEVAPKALQDDIRRELEEATQLVDFFLAAETGVRDRLGQPAELRGRGGTLEAFEDGVIQFKTAEGDAQFETLAQLPARDIIRFAEYTLPAADMPLAKARFLIAEGSIEPAEAALRALEDAGRDVQHLRARLKRLARKDPIKAARQSLDDSRELLVKNEREQAAARLQELLEDLRDLPGTEALRAEAETLLRNAQRPAPTYSKDARPAVLRIACHGRYEVFINGQSLATGLYRPGEFDVYDLRVAPGDTLAVQARGDGPGRALYALLLVDEGRYAVPTGSAWLCSLAPGPEWLTAAQPGGVWEKATPAYAPHAKPGYEEAAKGLAGFWIWGDGASCAFRRTITLATTVAEAEAQDTARQKKLTARFGPPVSATVDLACRRAYRLYHNGRLVGCAATFNPNGSTYDLRLRQGDVLGVHADDLEPEDGWLDAVIRVARPKAAPIRTDRTWVYTTEPGEDWNHRGAPTGAWRAPYFYDTETFRVRADARSAYFRKTIDLENLPTGRWELNEVLHGHVKTKTTRAGVVYDFKDPEQLADWRVTGDWVWQRGMVGGTGGALVTEPYRMHDIQIEAQVDAGERLSLHLMGEERGSGYELRFTDTRRGDVYLRRPDDTLDHARLPGARNHTRLIGLRKQGPSFSVWVDNRKIMSVRDEEPIPADQLWRVAFTTVTERRTHIRGVRIIGVPDWEALRDDMARRHDRPTAQEMAAAEAKEREAARAEGDGERPFRRKWQRRPRFPRHGPRRGEDE
jgi:serine/threonine-protein kinase